MTRTRFQSINKQEKDLFSRERRARTPTKGLRVRLRTALRQSGIVEKFRTDEMRRNNGELVVISKVHFNLPFNTFENRSVRFIFQGS